MTENSNAAQSDVDTTNDVAENEVPTYFEMVVIHQLHRMWELQIATAMLLADDDDEREFIQSLVDKQLTGDYQTPMQW